DQRAGGGLGFPAAGCAARQAAAVADRRRRRAPAPLATRPRRPGRRLARGGEQAAGAVADRGRDPPAEAGADGGGRRRAAAIAGGERTDLTTPPLPLSPASRERGLSAQTLTEASLSREAGEGREGGSVGYSFTRSSG